jgi:hypothetical protein
VRPLHISHAIPIAGERHRAGLSELENDLAKAPGV